MPRLLFEKTGDSVWISHLDLMRVFQRAFRRAGLSLKHSQGFTPRAIVSIALPLSVGVESQCELLDYELLEGEATAQRLNEVLPDGIRVLEIIENGRKIKDLAGLRALVTFIYDNGVPNHAAERLNALFERESLVISKHGKRGDTQTDILPMLYEKQIKQTSPTCVEMEVLVSAQNPALNPQLLLTAVEVYEPELMPDYSTVKRLEIYDTEGSVFR